MEFFLFVAVILLAMIWIRLGGIRQELASVRTAIYQQLDGASAKPEPERAGEIAYYLRDIQERISDNFPTDEERQRAIDNEP